MSQKLVFWDFTGTLADESDLDSLICQDMEYAIAEKKGIQLWEARKEFKDHLKKYEHTWKWHDYVFHGEVFDIGWSQYHWAHFGRLDILPHAVDVLKYTRERGYKNILATNGVRRVMMLRLGYADLLPLFDLTVMSDDVKALKSEGKHFEYGLKFFNGDPNLSFSVGDNPIQDIKPANELGMKTIFCDSEGNLTHYHSNHISDEHLEMHNADHIISNLSEIMDIIK